MPTRVTINDAKLTFWTSFYTRRYTEKVMDYCHERAQKNARGGPYSKGHLWRTIHKRGPIMITVFGRGSIYSTADYAHIVEKGASIHQIFPKGAPHRYRFGDKRRPQLRFAWRGRIVYTPHVPMGPRTIGRSHPGMDGKHFMRNAVLQTAVRFQMRISGSI